jgi:hypothetical protein
LKNAHLLRCAANLIAQRISTYASLFGFWRALHLSIFEQPGAKVLFNTLTEVFLVEQLAHIARRKGNRPLF